MKGTQGDLKLLQRTKVIFAIRSAIFIRKDTKADDHLLSAKVSDNQYWIYEKIKNSYDFLNYNSPEISKLVPARAYHKILEAQEIMELGIIKDQSVVEIGSAPGGISYYLLELGVQLVAIDPALMENQLLETHTDRLKHIKKSIFDIDRSHLPNKVDWIVSDLNLDGDLNINQSLKIMNFYPKLKGAFLTIKAPNPEDCRRIKAWEAHFRDKYSIQVCNLPSHRREIGFILRTKS